MIKKLKRKFVAINIILITVVLAITFAAIYVSTSSQIVRDTSNIMQRAMDMHSIKEPPKIEIGKEKPISGGGDFRAAISTFSVQLDENNKLLQVYENNILSVESTVLDEMIATCLANGKSTGVLNNVDFRYMLQKNDLGTKIVFADRTEEIDRLSSLVKNSLLVGAGSLIAFYFISLFLAQWAVKPIEKSLLQQRRFVADASHELKTPLTVILANTDIVLTNKEKTVEQQRKWIEYIKIEAQRMTSLVNDMLFLAKADDSVNNVVHSEVNLSDTVWSCILPFESVAFEQGKTIDSTIENDILIKGEEGKLKQLVGILVDNAIKYASDKGHVTVKLSQSQDKIKFSVNNTGEPIPEDQLSHIFERFYRVDKARTREKGGYGLGLSIAESIVYAHHGKITVTSTVENGTTFTVVFPK